MKRKQSISHKYNFIYKVYHKNVKVYFTDYFLSCKAHVTEKDVKSGKF